MSNSFHKVWIHAIWSTKNRAQLINSEIEAYLYPFLYQQFKAMDCPLKILNGTKDHLHCLFLLNPGKALADVLKQAKGSSSHYINQLNIKNDKFAWQNGYGAFSISESAIEKVYTYIKNQKQHHSIKSFEQEYSSFIELYGLSGWKRS